MSHTFWRLYMRILWTNSIEIYLGKLKTNIFYKILKCKYFVILIITFVVYKKNKNKLHNNQKGILKKIKYRNQSRILPIY